ncbi:MAG: hypothetical protein H0U74_02285 [Bradymonadaceae bacterium]|nr:hypothetical protein [Lujinxingiaceae bacterium]
MNRNDVKLLASVRNYPCVSVLLPTYRMSPENRQDPIRVKKLLKEAADRLQSEFGKRDAQVVLDRLGELSDQIDYHNTLDGLALFANADMARIYYLPFAVRERVVVDETFATRDLVYTLNRSPSYWLLHLSEKHTRLYDGVHDSILEIKEEGFPMVHEGPGGSAPLPGGIGVSKSAHRDERHRQFFRQVDAAFGKSALNDRRPLFIAGIGRYHAFFDEVTQHKGWLAGTIEGNYDKVSDHELGKRVGPAVADYLATSRQAVLTELSDAVGAQLAVTTVGVCWRLAQEGRGAKLIVEDGFEYPARLDASGLVLTPADDVAAPDVIDDVIDELIEAVIEKGGEVAFVDNGSLAKSGRVAMILRY